MSEFRTLNRCLDNAIAGAVAEFAYLRLTAGLPGQHEVFEVFSLADFITEIRLSATLEAQVSDCAFSVSEVDTQLALDADRDLLLSAVGDLLQNAFKFTHPRSEVQLNAYATGDRIRIEVEDECGGLPPGSIQKLFQPFTQLGRDRSGLRLGLTICRSSVEASGGILSVHDLPGTGCVFIIDLPRHFLLDRVPTEGASD